MGADGMDERDLLAALLRGRTDVSLDEVMERFEAATGGRVTRTEEQLNYLTLDQPGPEVIHSGTIGKAGLAAWKAPRKDGAVLIFFANVERKGGADFVRVRLDPAARALYVEFIDCGWFEVAAYLG